MAWEQIGPKQVAVAAHDRREKNTDNPELPELELRVGDVLGRQFSSDYEARPGYWMGTNNRLGNNEVGEYPLNKVVSLPQTVRYRAFELVDEGFHFNN